MPATARPKAYSYVRFSTPEQMRGDSFKRQTSMAQQYAAAHGLDLDEELTFQDLGVSAFRGRNMEAGRLADFLEAVKAGQVQRGSYLLVEALDRISRMVPRRAVRVLEDIIEEGVIVVTLNDGRRYTPEALDGDGGLNLLVALVTFMRANEESATKARRLRHAWESKRQDAQGRPLTSVVPHWLRLDKDSGTIVEIPERVAVVRRVFGEYLAGVGTAAIAAGLNRDGVPCFGRGTQWWDSYIAKMLDSDTVCGVLTPHRKDHGADGRTRRVALEKVPDYYPAIITRETFDEVQTMRQGKRTGRSRPGAVVNMLAGLAHCPLCGSTMTRVYKGGARKAGLPKLVCVKAKGGAGCTYHGVSLAAVEDALVAKRWELRNLMPQGDDNLQTRSDALDAAIDALRDAAGNLTDALSRGYSEAVAGRLREVEEELTELENQRREILERMAASADLVRERRADALSDALEGQPVDPARVNAALRRLAARVVVDYPQGVLRLEWLWGGQSEVRYAWPQS